MEISYYATMIFFFLTEGVVSKSDKVDFRAKNTTNSKKFYFIMLKSSIH